MVYVLMQTQLVVSFETFAAYLTIVFTFGRKQKKLALNFWHKTKKKRSYHYGFRDAV
jgi:hypothetical protein